MANSEHLAKILESVGAWNDWRKANTEIVPDLSRADLSDANLRWADLEGGNLRRANLFEADLIMAQLRGADLCEANFGEANLCEANLCEANLIRANLTGAGLREANLIRANLTGADLREADLRRADLSRANLYGADLREADLRGADLSNTNLTGAGLTGADLTGAFIAHTTFGDTDLSDVKGLDTVRHHGPSTIGIDTIYRSHGNIPLAFLRGAGVPDNFIEFMASLTGNALEFYSCFISYSTKNQEFAERLHGDLQNQGVRCWFAPHDVQGGKKLHEQIDEAIRRYERLLLILSPNSMNSEWVKTEIRKARKRERTEKKRVLFPVRLVSFESIQDWELFDADEGKDLAVEIREYYIPDFSGWKNHDSYAKEFKKLLRDLKAKGSKRA